MTPEQYESLPPERVLKWIKGKLAQQEKQEGKKAPLVYTEWIALVERLLSEPIEIPIGNKDEFDKLDELGF